MDGELNYRNTINSLGEWAGLSLPRVGDIASRVVVREDLRLPRFDFPINTFPHRVSPQIRALCGLLRRIAISEPVSTGDHLLGIFRVEAKSDFHHLAANLMFWWQK